jgi:hypothetical protein
MPEFVPLAERIVDAVLESDPGLASYAGDHRFDAVLPDRSPEAVADRVAMLRDAADALSGVDPDDVGPQDQVDHAILSAMVERDLFELTDVREHEWNPLTHNPGPLLHMLMARSFAPLDERLTSLAGRLRGIPDALATARSVLRDMPRVHVETAIGQFAGTGALIKEELPGLLAREPGLQQEVWRAAELTGAPATDETVRAALGSLAEQHPDDGTILDLAKLTMSEATDFVRGHDVLTLIDDPCVIEEMPEFARGVAVAYCDAPGPLETAEVPTFYCISPAPADWAPERVESFYREYNDHMLRDMTVHEAMPGHFLQLAHARRGADGRARLRRPAGAPAAAQDATADEHQRDHRPARALR